jgi:hypothetical protein
VRSLLVAAASALALAAPAGPAVATPGPTGPGDVHPEWGSTTGHDATIRKGCRSYAYDYAVTPPEGYWSLETFLVGPGGQEYGSGYFLTGYDPLTGTGTFRLCRRSSRSGTYVIRARVTVGDDFTGYRDGWLPDSTFRLKKSRRHHR